MLRSYRERRMQVFITARDGEPVVTPVVRAWIAEEVKALLAIEAGRTLGELLEEAGLAATARAMLVPRVDTHAAQVVATDAFAEWLGDLVG